MILYSIYQFHLFSRKEGFQALYGGLSPGLQRQMTMSGTKLFFEMNDISTTFRLYLLIFALLKCVYKPCEFQPSELGTTRRYEMVI